MLARKLGKRGGGRVPDSGFAGVMSVDGDLLLADELADLEAGIDALASAESEQPEQIRESTEQLGRASEVSARRMDRSIQKALQGVALSELETDAEAQDEVNEEERQAP